MQETRAEGGTVLVMDPQTGAVLALAALAVDEALGFVARSAELCFHFGQGCFGGAQFIIELA